MFLRIEEGTQGWDQNIVRKSKSRHNFIKNKFVAGGGAYRKDSNANILHTFFIEKG